MSDRAPVVFVVDDNASFLRSITRMLQAAGFLVKAFSSARDFLAQYSPETSGCVVADVEMPGLSGIGLMEALAETDNPLPIVFLTGHGDIPSSVNAIRHGAEDFLTKRATKDELLSAICRALAREKRERQARARLRELKMRFDKLTPRDREVLTHVLRGELNKQIAAALCIDERSVKRHRTSLMRKLQVQSVAELLHLAHAAGIISPGVLSESASASQAPVPKGTLAMARQPV